MEPQPHVAGVAITHPNKVLFPDHGRGVSKLDLARYYLEIEHVALPHLRHRPLTLLRCPDGHHRRCFYQKRARGLPEEVPRVEVKPGEDPYTMIDDVASLVALAQLGVLELHVWGSRVEDLEHPDLMVLDLDPAPGTPWREVVGAAHEIRERVEGAEMAAFVRLTGGKGVHVVVPLTPRAGWDEVKGASHALARQLVREHPDRFTARLSKQARAGKIFIDYLRNAREATAIGAYSARARAGAPVALPVRWDALDPDRDDPPRFGIREVPDRVRQAGDPWADFEAARVPLTAERIRRLARPSGSPR